jgi:hypothetical protein
MSAQKTWDPISRAELQSAISLKHKLERLSLPAKTGFSFVVRVIGGVIRESARNRINIYANHQRPGNSPALQARE